MIGIADVDPGKIEPLDVDMYGQEIKSDPSKYFLRWATQKPRYLNYNGHLNGLLTRHEDVKQALLNYELFSAVPVQGTGTSNLDYFNGLPIIVEHNPPSHTRLRRLMQPAFTPRVVSQVQDSIVALAHKMLDAIEQRGNTVEIISDLAHPFPTTVILGNFLNLPQETWPIFLRYSEALGLVSTLKDGDPKPPEYMAAYNDAFAYCESLIKDRRHTPKDDLIGKVVGAHDEGGQITTEELFATLIVLMTGGIGTIAGTLGLAMLRLGRNPDQMELLRREPELINSTIEEVLRIDSLGNFRHRWAAKDFEYEGLQFYKDMPVALCLGAANYDPVLYPNPEKFDIRRAPTDLATFGYGVHFCIGQGLARPALRTMVTALVQRFPKLRLQDPNFEPYWTGMPTERWPASVPMQFD